MERLSRVVGPVATNVHILADTRSREAIAIDTAIPSLDWVRDELAARDWTLKLIVTTHGHWDHMGDNARVAEHTGALIAVHPLDAHRLTNPPPARWTPLEIPPCVPAVELQEGGEVRFGSIRLEVLHTPGHTPGSCSFVLQGGGKQVVFAGDTLFAGSIGRTDLWGGDTELILKSLHGKLLALDDDTAVVTGHGQGTSIGRERRSNPFLGAGGLRF